MATGVGHEPKGRRSVSEHTQAVPPRRDDGSVDVDEQTVVSTAGGSSDVAEPQPAPPSPFAPPDTPDAGRIDAGTE